MTAQLVPANQKQDLESEVERLVLQSFQDTDNYEHLLANAFSLAEQMSVDKGAFYQVYITQCRFRIEAAIITDVSEKGSQVSPVRAQRKKWLQDKILDSIDAMTAVKSLLQKKKESLAFSVSKKRKLLQAFSDRSEFCNGWAWYSLAGISDNGLQEYALTQADKIFTSFLARENADADMPVIVNCLYGKGLCLRDSGRNYDLLTMLDNMPARQAAAVKFARLRLAAAVKLNMSLDILKVVQDYFDLEDKDRKLNSDELEMLVNCIEASIVLLERDLPDNMKESLRKELVKVVDLTEGYGNYWQQRVAKIIADTDIRSSYVKLIQAYEQTSDTAGSDYELVNKLAVEGIELCQEDEVEKIKEFQYLKAVSCWNLGDFEGGYVNAVEFVQKNPEDKRIKQMVDIATNAALQLIVDNKDKYQEYINVLTGYYESGLLESDMYYWTKGCLIINSGRYEEGFRYFTDENIVLEPKVKRYYGQMLAIVPMFKNSRIDEEKAVNVIEECCREFLLSKDFITASHLVDSIEISCDIAELLIKRERYSLVRRVLSSVNKLPYVRDELSSRMLAIEFQLRLYDQEDIFPLVDIIADRSCQHSPYIFNVLLNFVSANKESYNDSQMVKIYKILLSSKLLKTENAIALRVYLAGCYFRLAMYMDFIETMTAIQKNNKDYLTAENYRQLAIASQEVGQYHQAIEYWGIVQLNLFKMDNSGMEALYNKVVCCYCDGQIEKSRQILALAMLREKHLQRNERFLGLRKAITSEMDFDCHSYKWQDNISGNDIMEVAK